MSEPRVVVRPEERKRAPVRPWAEGATFRVVGWVGIVLALAALGDFALAIYPLGFGSPEWEVGTIGAVVQGFPLLSVGLICIWVRGGGLGERRLLLATGIGFLVVSAVLVLMLGVLLTDLPIALRGTRGSEEARLGILKLMVKTVYLAALFGLLHGIAGVLALRQARGVST